MLTDEMRMVRDTVRISAERDLPPWKAREVDTTEVAKRVALDSRQLHGGYGDMMEFDIQRYVRDALVLTIGGGTSQIQKNLIARELKIGCSKTA